MAVTREAAQGEREGWGSRYDEIRVEKEEGYWVGSSLWFLIG